MKIESILSYNSQKFLEGGTFATVTIIDNEKKYIVEMVKKRHLAYFEHKGVRYLVHNVGHLICPKFELVA